VQKVLIVDDEPDIRELLEITLSRMNLQSSSAADLAEALDLLKTQDFHLCLTDMRLPDGDGLELVQKIQTEYPHIPVAVITAHGSTETAIAALKAGAFDFVSKPVDLIKLRALVSSALKLSHEPAQESKQDAPLPVNIIGESKQIKELKNQISKLARSQAPVFISGESGSGKELAARAIHALGPRKDKEFVAINCGAIPSELMESEFFGHIKGSFTGADKDKSGLFKAADGGSLFLDEIADLPLHMQVKLLRAIQEKSVRPVGAQHETPVDVRIISASHKNLQNAVKTGSFRQDLFYRINVIELQVPSLREHRMDIPILTQHILDRLSQDQHADKVKISQDALEKLEKYDFPGNIRELENLLQRAYALCENNQIEHIDLPVTSSTRELPSGDFSLEEHLEEVESSAILNALEATRWNKTAAAEKLGMSFRSFRYRIKKLGLDDK